MVTLTCVDDFYTNPNEIRKYALLQNFSWTAGNFPGVRTAPLEYINPYFHSQFCKRLFSIFYNFDCDDLEVSVNTHFQKITPYSKDKHDLINSGWYHHDGGENILAGVIYLTPNPSLDSGTTFAKQINPAPTSTLPLRDELYKHNDIEKIDVNEYKTKLLQHNCLFEETIQVKNVYNRLILYDANVPHKESNFFCSESEPRLTQVFFITKFKTKKRPIDRIQEHEIRSSKLFEGGG